MTLGKMSIHGKVDNFLGFAGAIFYYQVLFLKYAFYIDSWADLGVPPYFNNQKY